MKTRFATAAAAGWLILSAVPGIAAQQPPPATEVGADQHALMIFPAKNGAKLTVTSPAFAPSGVIPFENTQYRGNVFPGLSWTAGPSGTKAYVVILQDLRCHVARGSDPSLDHDQHPGDCRAEDSIPR